MQIDQRVSYAVSLHDLQQVADAACKLQELKQFYVDRPAEIDAITHMIENLHDLVERAAGESAVPTIYSPSDGSAP